MCFLPGLFKKILALRIIMLAIGKIVTSDGAVTATVLLCPSKGKCVT